MNKDNIKYIILVGDGMADYPLPEIDGKTPLEIAHTPNMDRIAACRIGVAQTIPDRLEPGSDVANLSILGYDPEQFHTGRAPLEAASMDVKLDPDQVAFRMNLVTLDRISDKEIIMKSHSSGDIGTDEATEIVKSIKKELSAPGIEIYPGVAYRHLLVWDKGPEKKETIPPHDVLDQNMADYLFKNPGDPVADMIKGSWPLLEDHPVNRQREKAGLKKGNSIWLWGQGKAPSMPLFKDRFGISGGVISAVDLLKGIGIYAGFKSIHVEGATGYLDTNYKGKAENALKALETLDFIFLHVEAPDEAAHNGNLKDKVQAIEDFDKKVVRHVLNGLSRFQEYRVMVISDHYTPIVKKTHTREPTPFAWAAKNELEQAKKGAAFTENHAAKSGLIFKKGHELIGSFIE